MKEEILLSVENSKLCTDGIACFGLPSPKTCIGASKKCKKYCYTNFHAYCYPNVKKARARNLRLSKNDYFSELVSEAIDYLPRFFKYIRIHDSGDFYSQKYLDNWKRIASTFPDIKFYAYTKSLILDFSYSGNNFHTIQSLGGKYDTLIDFTKPIAKIFNDEESLTKSGYVNCTHSELKVLDGYKKIGLIARGTGRHIWRKLENDNSSNKLKKSS